MVVGEFHTSQYCGSYQKQSELTVRTLVIVKEKRALMPALSRFHQSDRIQQIEKN
jgi:hypothetical protein